MYINDQSITAGNKSIATFLGYEYVPNNSSNRGNPTYQDGTLMLHGFWRRKYTSLTDLVFTSKDGLPLTIYTPKLLYHNSWDDLMRIVVRLENLSDYVVEVTMDKVHVELRATHEDEDRSFHISVQYKKNDFFERRKTLWYCVANFCEHYNKQFN